MSGVSGSYNAVTWLLDRNVDEGRGAKLAFTDTVSNSHGDLQNRAAAQKMLRWLRPSQERGDDHADTTDSFHFRGSAPDRAGALSRC